MKKIYPHSLTIRATPFAPRKSRAWAWWLVIILIGLPVAWAIGEHFAGR